VTVAGVLIKGGVEIRSKFEVKGNADQLNNLSRSITAKIITSLKRADQ
jgi:hypothetical protein